MEFFDVVRKRGSCRKYDPALEVPKEFVSKLLAAAIYAPSAGNLQNWVFIMLQDKNKKLELRDACLKQDWMQDASLWIVICNDKERVTKLYPVRGELYSIQNCAVASENIMLAAEDLGLGSCWVGAFDPIAFKRILKLPESIEPEMVITIGYGLEKQSKVIRDEREYVVYFDEFGNSNIPEGIFPISRHVEKLQEEVKKGLFKRLFGK
ncbi:nitroreductase family protein [Candidatus Woesearchaeota archaeon]|nr:nitroreductase family protein [Candidatus Woesearchaeota archaeon]